MAAAGAPIRVPVAVACRVLGLSTQGYYKWLKDPVSQRDWDDAHAIDALRDIHEDDPTLGYRFLTDELDDVGIVASENRVCAALLERPGSSPPITAGRAKPASPVRRSTTICSPSSMSSGRITSRLHRHRPRTRSGSPTSPNTRPREGKLYLCAVKDVLLQQDRRLLHRLADEVRLWRPQRCATRSACVPRPAPSCTPTEVANSGPRRLCGC